MEEIKNEAKEVRVRAIGYIGAAMGLVAGLAWNEAITSLINALFPISKDSVWMKFVYAGIITVVVVLVIQNLDRFANKEPKQ